MKRLTMLQDGAAVRIKTVPGGGGVLPYKKKNLKWLLPELSRYLLGACGLPAVRLSPRVVDLKNVFVPVIFIIFCCWSGIYLLGVEMNLRHAHKTRFWYHLGVFSKFFDDHPRQFYLAPENWNTTDIKPSQLSTKFKAIWSQFAVVPVHLFTADGSFLLLNYSALCLMGFQSRNSFPATNSSRLVTGAARACLDVSAKPVSLVLKHKTFT